MPEMFTFKNIEFGVGFGLEYKEDIPSYGRILSLLFPEKAWLYEEEGDYQGQWFAVGIDESGYWFHQGDFGSCSGCDTIQGISSVSDAVEFLTIMNRLTPIGASATEAVAYLEKTNANMWSGASEAIEKIIAQLRAAA